jgi:predicted RNA-binding Zn ribbon-like protein
MKHEAFDFSMIKPLHEHLCLDFVNSTPNHQNPNENYLNSYADLVSWGLDVKLLSLDEAEHLWDIASHHPDQAAALYQQAIVLREAIYHILLAITHDRVPKAADLATLNASLSEAMSHMRLESSGSGFEWMWNGDTHSIEYIIWRAAWSASELLLSDALNHVRKCEGCDWLFIDTSRSRRRRWCDMTTCGNRAKARRHYTRTREE